jgi:hypothetical protein
MRIVALMFSLTSMFVCLTPEKPIAQAEGTPHVASPIVVPFEPAPSPYIVIRVPVAGGPCEALVFDTGTTTTVLTAVLAARIGLSGGVTTHLESLIGSERAVRGEVRGIGFDGVPAEGPRVAIATATEGLRQFGDGVVGLYGHNWLRGTDYLIDYGAKRIVMGSTGRLPTPTGGLRTPLTWAEGLPVVIATVRAGAVEPFSGRFVLDSGADHLTLFGRAADRLARLPDRGAMVIDSGFGMRSVPSVEVSVDVRGRGGRVTAEIRTDVRDREEDGLVPTSLFHSVFVGSADGVVVLDTRVPLPPQPAMTCTHAGRQ